MISQRSPVSEYQVFTKVFKQQGFLSYSELELLEKINQTIWQPTHMILINTSVKTCLQRCNKSTKPSVGLVSPEFLELVNKN